MDNTSKNVKKKCPENLDMSKKSKNNQSIPEEGEQIIRHYQPFFTSNKEEVLGTLLKRIDQNEKYAGKIIPAFQWIRVAGISVAATVAVLVSFWFFTASETLSTGSEETSVFRLPDDSRIVLHHESSVTFNKYIQKRTVKLTGEAYFEVEKGNGFRVKTSQGDVEVLGTRFLVCEKNHQLNVQCFQGTVKTNFEKNSWILEPGTQFIGKNDDPQKIKFEKEASYPEFATFSRNFSNVPLDKVIREIEEFFDVEINLAASPGKKFSGTIHSGNLENILQIVCKPLQLNFRPEGQNSFTIY